MNWWILRRGVHTSWLITYLGVGVLGGLVLAGVFPTFYFDNYLWLVVVTSLLFLGFWQRNISVVPLLIIAGLLVGLVRGSATQIEMSAYGGLVGKTATISGVVSEDVDVGKKGELVVRLVDLSMNGGNLPGKIWVSLNQKADLKRSDRITIRGEVNRGFGSFAASIYHAKLVQATRDESSDIALNVRDKFSEGVNRYIDQPESGLGLGYLLGQKSNLPDDLILTLQAVGLTHIVVASGYNLSVLVRLTRRAFARVSRYLSFISAIAMIVGFVSITGLSPSMTRAGIVAGLGLVAWYFGRKFHPVTLLIIVASGTALWNPGYLWGDMGWLLSFLSFGGVMIVAPLLQRYFFGDKEPGTLRQIAGETVSAQFVTLPIIIYSFGSFSLLSLLANLMILPLVPLAMLVVFGVGFFAWLPIVAVMFGWLAQVVLGYMISVANFFADETWAQIEIQMPLWLVLVCYGAIAAAVIYLLRVTKYRLRDSSIVE